jgi:hypothetical protein
LAASPEVATEVLVFVECEEFILQAARLSVSQGLIYGSKTEKMKPEVAAGKV